MSQLGRTFDKSGDRVSVEARLRPTTWFIGVFSSVLFACNLDLPRNEAFTVRDARPPAVPDSAPSPMMDHMSFLLEPDTQRHRWDRNQGQ